MHGVGDDVADIGGPMTKDAADVSRIAVYRFLRGDIRPACRLLREGSPLSLELRKLIADRLEGQLTFEPGRKSQSTGEIPTADNRWVLRGRNDFLTRELDRLRKEAKAKGKLFEFDDKKAGQELLKRWRKSYGTLSLAAFRNKVAAATRGTRFAARARKNKS